MERIKWNEIENLPHPNVSVVERIEVFDILSDCIGYFDATH